jgi:hypothetical protein
MPTYTQIWYDCLLVIWSLISSLLPSTEILNHDLNTYSYDAKIFGHKKLLFNCLQVTLSFMSQSNIWYHPRSTQTFNHDINPLACDANIYLDLIWLSASNFITYIIIVAFHWNIKPWCKHTCMQSKEILTKKLFFNCLQVTLSVMS